MQIINVQNMSAPGYLIHAHPEQSGAWLIWLVALREDRSTLRNIAASSGSAWSLSSLGCQGVCLSASAVADEACIHFCLAPPSCKTAHKLFPHANHVLGKGACWAQA